MEATRPAAGASESWRSMRRRVSSGIWFFSEPNFIVIVFSRRIGARASFGAIKSHLMVNQI
jgi:hypothetical protein